MTDLRTKAALGAHAFAAGRDYYRDAVAKGQKPWEWPKHIIKAPPEYNEHEASKFVSGFLTERANDAIHSGIG